MRRAFSIPLMRQTALSFTIGAVAALGWLCESFIPFPPQPLITLWIILCFVLTIGSYVAAIWISYDVRTGVESGRWPESEIERLRIVYSASWLKALSLTLAIAAIFFFLFGHSSHHELRDLGFDCLLLSQVSQQILMAARRPKSSVPGQRIDWHSASPITSDHWGQTRP